ncbi:carboxypeptidase regulatory-like domain-containing protein [Promicromonospora sp. NPDC057488]|uniref:carboxypeptidase regulatory-like domain-containing protein n=1 Tax=Promicromonospora sp. NPDC057488 TaxID=3346147 RepID=UPI00367237FD
MGTTSDWSVWVNDQPANVWVTESRAVANFSFTGSVTVRVKYNPGFSTFAIEPARYGITSSALATGEASFVLTDENDYRDTRVIFRANGDITKELFIFGDKPVDVPTASGVYTNVVTIPAGVTEPSAHFYRLQSNTIYYFEPGAVLRATTFAKQAENIKIVGPGIIVGYANTDGKDPSKIGTDHTGPYDEVQGNHLDIVQSSNVSIEDVIVTDVTAGGGIHNVTVLYSQDVTSKNLKVISRDSNGDGFSVEASSNVRVQDFFAACSDNVFVIGWNGLTKDVEFDNVVANKYGGASTSTIFVQGVSDSRFDPEVGNGRIEDITIKNLYVTRYNTALIAAAWGANHWDYTKNFNVENVYYSYYANQTSEKTTFNRVDPWFFFSYGKGSSQDSSWYPTSTPHYTAWPEFMEFTLRNVFYPVDISGMNSDDRATVNLDRIYERINGEDRLVTDKCQVATCNNTLGSDFLGTLNIANAASDSGQIAGTVKDQDGAPLAGATVSINGGPTATTNAAGFYALTGLGAGRYTVTASRDSYTTASADQIVATVGSTTFQGFALEDPDAVADTSLSSLTISDIPVDVAALTTTGEISVTVPANRAITTATVTATTINPTATAVVSVSGGGTAAAEPTVQIVVTPVSGEPRTYRVHVVAGPADVIPNVTVQTPTKLQAVRRGEVGAVQYVDRTYKLVQYPESLTGAVLIPGASGDKLIAGTTNYLRFTVERDSTVYVAFDTRGRGSWWPAWVGQQGFVETDLRAKSDDGSAASYVLFAKDVTAGTTVALGGNNGSSAETASYFTLVAEHEPTPALTTEVTVETRCVAGKVVLAATATNTNEVPVAVTLQTPYGSKAIASIAPGTDALQPFTTRLGTVPAGEVTVTARATIGGAPVTVTDHVAYNNRTC